ncbi:MAG: cadmium-translocating P-type ATPase, partial [Thermoplasmata archaeon]|nr:cadmium-translocating P-type ATPase [Thermoplasmata archaeon]
MDCIDCVNKLQKALANTDGIRNVSLNFTSGKGKIEFNPEKITLIRLNDIIEKMGYQMIGEVVKYSLDSIHCRDCGHDLERKLEGKEGIIDASVSFGAKIVTVNYVPKEIKNKRIEESICSMGYSILHSEEDLQVGVRKQRRAALLLGLSGVLFGLGWILYWSGLDRTFFDFEWNWLVVEITIPNILFLLSLVIPGYTIARGGLYSLKGRVITIDLLVILAAMGAILIGTYWEASAVVLLTAFGELLQDLSVERTRKALSKLLEGTPKTAWVKRGTEIVEIDISELGKGDVAVVKAGEKIPADGEVFKGEATVNQAPITGESVPVTRRKGDQVFGGTLSEDGYLEIRVVKTGDDTTISRIVKLIQEAQEEKAPAQRFIERFAEIFVPAVIVLSILALIITRDVTNSLTLFVVACPCALVISTPVAVVSGLGNAAKQGILIKGGVALEQMGKVRTVVFDKTGTLTMGQHGVSEIYASPEVGRNEVLRLAALAEQRSEHPLSKAIMIEAEKYQFKIIEPEGFQVIKGKGVIAEFEAGKRILVGNEKLLKDSSIAIPPTILDQARRMESKALTVFFVVENKDVMGIIGTSDMERPEARKTIADLKRMKIRTVMLSGDNSTTVRVVAGRLGLDEAYGGLLPEEKVNHIKRLREMGVVGMVGDGINDAPALATADIGIA